MALLGSFVLFLTGIALLLIETMAGLTICAAALVAAYAAFQRPERAAYAPFLCIGVALASLFALLALGASSVFFGLWLFSGGLIGLAGVLQWRDRGTPFRHEPTG